MKKRLLPSILSTLLGIFACGVSDSTARSEMQPAYRSAKLLVERLKAGANFKEFGELRANLAADLSIVRDALNNGGLSSSTLRRYYSAYESALGGYTFAASVWQHNILMDECIGPQPPSLEASQANHLSIEERIEAVNSTMSHLKRVMACTKQDGKQAEVLQQQAKAMKIDCSEVEYHLDCVLKNAEAKLESAEALLLKK